MATISWEISGQYVESCSCDFICPCLPGHMAVKPTKGSCTFAMAFHVDQGHFGVERLDDMSFVIMGRTPEEMGKGNWDVGLIVDERASTSQQEAFGTICSGQAGGPMAALAGLVGHFHGIQAAPIRVANGDGKWSASAGQLLDQTIEPVEGMGGQPLFLDNTGHPAANRFGLAKAQRSHVHVFGMDWDDDSGRNNGQYAPFHWQAP
jgi:hypothetical protein